MSKKLYNYTPDQVTMTFGGELILGYGTGDFVSISKKEDTFTMVEGARGDATRTLNESTTYTVTITLLAGSASNDAMSRFYIADTASGGLGTLTFFMKDTRGRDVFLSEAAWIMKPADIVKGKESGDREWTLECFNGVYFGGGL